MIPIARPYIPPGVTEAVANVLASDWIGQGPLVDEFERKFATKFGLDPECCIGVNSGTSALEIAYDLLDISEYAVVMTTALTCTATSVPIIRRGACIHFADIRRDTLLIDPGEIRARVESEYFNKNDDVLVNVHLHGIESNVEHSGFRNVVHDAAQSLGIFRGRFTACSFQAIKHITTGDGGMLWCENQEDAQEARLLRWFGIDRRKKLANGWQPYRERKILYDIEAAGYKFQMTDIAAAMGIVGLDYYDEILEHRRLIFETYRSAGLPVVDGPNNKYGYCCLLVEDRDDFARRMLESGVETNVMHVRNDVYALFSPYRRRLPNMDWVESRYICIPCHNRMSLDDANRVAEAAQGAYAPVAV